MKIALAGCVLVAVAAGCRDRTAEPAPELPQGTPVAAGDHADPVGADPDWEPDQPGGFEEGDPLADLPEVGQRPIVLWDLDGTAGVRAAWRPREGTAIGLEVAASRRGDAYDARLLAGLGRAVPVEVYRCQGLDPEDGGQVRVLADGEGNAYLVCVNLGRGGGSGSSLAVRLEWDDQRNAVMPTAQFRAPDPDLDLPALLEGTGSGP